MLECCWLNIYEMVRIQIEQITLDMYYTRPIIRLFGHGPISNAFIMLLIFFFCRVRSIFCVLVSSSLIIDVDFTVRLKRIPKGYENNNFCYNVEKQKKNASLKLKQIRTIFISITIFSSQKSRSDKTHPWLNWLKILCDLRKKKLKEILDWTLNLLTNKQTNQWQ